MPTRTVLLVATLLVLAPASAQAYIDPGTGSYVLQAVVSAVAGSLVALRMYWQRIKAALGSRSESPPREVPESSESAARDPQDT